ncbi:MAG: carboxypeptidase-like regulatory domain-containing protein [Candidatus Kapabacteria bacterium]|nr:carboxypeptidase-like regulatory domain-containing protein [Candidatus Kapabacteria bacterium]
MKKIYLIFLTLTLFMSCKEQNQIKFGDIYGQLGYGVNAKVILKNTAFNAITDSNYNFLFKNVPEGIYDLFISLDGYDTTTIFGMTYTGDYLYLGINQPSETPTTVKFESGLGIHLFDLCKTKHGKFNNFAIDSNFKSLNGDSVLSYKFSMEATCTNSEIDVFLFFSADNTVNKYYSNNWYYTTFNKAVSMAGNISKKYLISSGFKSGQKIYAIAYWGSRDQQVGVIEDSRNSNKLWVGLSDQPSQVFEITIP